MDDKISMIYVFKARKRIKINEADYESWKAQGWLKEGDTMPEKKPAKKKEKKGEE